MTEDWSPPRIYGTPIPPPGDASALAVETAQPDIGDAWSAPIYHGPRRHRPRSFEQPVEQPVGAGGRPDRAAQPPPRPRRRTGRTSRR